MDSIGIQYEGQKRGEKKGRDRPSQIYTPLLTAGVCKSRKSIQIDLEEQG